MNDCRDEEKLTLKLRALAWFAAHMAVEYDYPRFDWSPGDDFADIATELNELGRYRYLNSECPIRYA